jgi:hypothetical protein
MTAWDNLLFGLVVLFALPFGVLAVSLVLRQLVHGIKQTLRSRPGTPPIGLDRQPAGKASVSSQCAVRRSSTLPAPQRSTPG